MRVLVFGSGISGMLAADLAVGRGHEVRVLSAPERSSFYGAQFLHKPPVSIAKELPMQQIHYSLHGTPSDYARKVYGDITVPVSPNSFNGMLVGWDIRKAYELLYERYHKLVEEVVVQNGQHFRQLVHEAKPDVVVSTIPAPLLCTDDSHAFHSQRVWAIGDAPELDVFCPVRMPEGSIVCDSTEEVGWYRAANVFGHCTAEWSREKRPPFTGVAAVIKPLGTTCTCQPDVVRGGRYGLWRKGELSHQAAERLGEVLR